MAGPFTSETYQSGDGNLNEPITVGRLGQPVRIGGGTDWQNIGSGPVADRPSAADFGHGTWHDGSDLYISDSIGWKKVSSTRLPTLKWDAAKAAASAGFGQARLLSIGDSTTVGYYATTSGSATVDSGKNSPPFRLAKAMTLRHGIPTSYSNIYGAHGISTAANLSAYDPRVTFGTGWAVSAVQTLGGNFLSNATTNLTAMSFLPLSDFDLIEIYWRRGSGFGTFTVDIGAGVLATISTSGTAGIGRTVVAATLGTNTVNLTKTNATTAEVSIAGISLYKLNAEVQVINAGIIGIAADTYFNSAADGPEAVITSLAPNLTTINLGINDIVAATPIETFKTKYQAIINKALLYGDVVLFVPNPTTGYANEAAYYQAIRDLGALNSLNVIDLSEGMGTDYAIPNALGLMSGVHPKTTGYKVIENITMDSGIFN